MSNNKYLLPVLSILILFVFIASASAADVNTTDVLSVDESANLENNLLSVDNSVKSNDTLSLSSIEDVNQTSDDTLSVSENINVISAKDDGTFTALQKKIDDAPEGSTITLENDYKNDGGSFYDGIVINKQLTINGNGHTIDGCGNSRIFYLKGKNIILNDIKFINGNRDYGGAVFIETNGTFINCNFADNHANYGGAVYIPNDDGTFINCSFVNNTASEGGAIYMPNFADSLSVINCTFINNAAKYASAIEGASIVYISNSKFFNNSAKQEHVIHTPKNLIINNCEFIDNSCKGVVMGNVVNVNSSFFKNNFYNSGGTYCISGYVTSKYNVTNCEFISNQKSPFIHALGEDVSLYSSNNKGIGNN